jgi:hypothetical protein
LGPNRPQPGMAQMRRRLHGLGMTVPPSVIGICRLWVYYTPFSAYVNNKSSAAGRQRN